MPSQLAFYTVLGIQTQGLMLPQQVLRPQNRLSSLWNAQFLACHLAEAKPSLND